MSSAESLPLLSVVMGVFRPDRCQLEVAVASVLKQTYPHFEFLICDDGSEDGTLEFLTAWSKREPRLHILQHSQNLGLAAALNTCISQARGSYIVRQDADDISVPERFEKQAAFLQQNPAFSFAGCAVSLFEENRVWGNRLFPEKPGKEDFLFTVPYMHGALMFRREVLLECGGYCVSRVTRRTEDYELLMRLYAHGKRGYNLQEPLYQFREDDSAVRRRRYCYRIDEAVVRLRGFSQLGLLPKGIPYVLKPLIVGLIPQNLLAVLKEKYYKLSVSSEKV